MALVNIFKTLVITNEILLRVPKPISSIRSLYRPVELPKPGKHNKAFRRIVHYPEKYTVKPLNVTNLAGRDPDTGRLVCIGIGGGIKHKFHWIDWKRDGPSEGPPQEEKVIKIIEDGCRTAAVALVAVGDKLKYILATENMKAGDIIRTSTHIPRIPVRAFEGDAYPLGALPLGTIIHNVAQYPGTGGFYCHATGKFATIVRKAPNQCIVIKIPSKREFSLPESCMCTVGRVSNIDHNKIPIGSPQRLRQLGYRPRSGLWHRKTGYHGRKIRPLPPVKTIDQETPKKKETVRLLLKCMNIDMTQLKH